MPPRPRPPADPGRPTPREALAKVRAEAAPRVAKAAEAAAPKVEKAAVQAGKVLGTLRERAKHTVKQFNEGYRAEAPDGPAGTEETGSQTAARRPRPRPRKD